MMEMVASDEVRLRGIRQGGLIIAEGNSEREI